MASVAAPLRLHRAVVRPEWVDYNGHMSEPYYVLVFGHATDALLDHIGMDEASRQKAATSLYTVEAHINYLAEAHEGEQLTIETQLLGHDAKRAHVHHAMIRDADQRLLATTELMLVHVDKTSVKASPFSPGPGAQLAAIAAAHAHLPRPKYAGRQIRLPAG